LTRIVGEQPIPAPVYNFEDIEDAKYTIIESPEQSLKFPFLPANPNEDFISYWSKHIIVSPLKENSFFAIVGPYGKGKTRTRMELMITMTTLALDMLPVAIALNKRCDYTLGKGALQYAFNIVVNILSMAYKQPFHLVGRELCQSLQDLFGDENYIVSATSLIQGCILHLVTQMRIKNPELNRFILFVDASMRNYDVQQFKIKWQPFGNIHEPLYNAMLMNPISPGLHCSLVMASTGWEKIIGRK
jgi:hypothetical protein